MEREEGEGVKRYIIYHSLCIGRLVPHFIVQIRTIEGTSKYLTVRNT